MGLYSGFDALGIGGAANNTEEIKRLRNLEMIKALGGLGQGIKEAIDKNARGEKALALANSLGIENASEIAGSLDPDDFAKFVMGVADEREAAKREKQKISDERQWNEYLKNDERQYKKSVLEEGRAYDENKADKMRAIQLLDKDYDTRKNLLMQVMAKVRDSKLPSRADIDEYNNAWKNINDFIAEHPEYGKQLSGEILSMSNGGRGIVTNDDRIDALKALVKNGVVDPREMQKLKEEWINDGIYSQFLEENGNDLWNMVASKVKGDPVTRNVFMVGSDKVRTEGDAKAAKKKADENAEKARINKIIENELKKMRDAYEGMPDNNGYLPDFDFSTLEKYGWMEENKNKPRIQKMMKEFKRRRKERR